MVAFMIWLQNSTPSYSFIKANKKVANMKSSNLEFWGLTSKNGSISVINCVNVINDKRTPGSEDPWLFYFAPIMPEAD